MAALLDAHPELAPYARGLMPRSFVRKAQYMYGWDWGPCLRGCGIWQDVQLVRVPVARIKDWSYRADFSDDGACRVTVWAGLDGAAGGAVATLSRGETSVSARSVVQGDAVELNLDLAAPERWWPAGYGDPALYDLVIAVERDGETVDTLSARVGLRTVELVREPDARGESRSSSASTASRCSPRARTGSRPTRSRPGSRPRAIATMWSWREAAA